jgi:hypothetical protein
MNIQTDNRTSISLILTFIFERMTIATLLRRAIERHPVEPTVRFGKGEKNTQAVLVS